MRRKQMKAKKTSNTLELNDSISVETSCVYKRDTKRFKIQNIDFDKIKSSKKKPYSKAHKAHKHFVLYEYKNEYVPLLLKLPDMIGCCKVFKDGKSINCTCKNERNKI